MDNSDKIKIRLASSVLLPSPIEREKNKFIYVKTKKDGKWGLPAGKINPFENPMQAGQREVLEEIGSSVILENFIGVYCFESERKNPVINLVYFGRIQEGLPKFKIKEGIEEVKECTYSDVVEMYRKRELRAGNANLDPLTSHLRGTSFPLDVVVSLIPESSYLMHNGLND